jgi:murein L,D-transpeptidase YcbB/YkuD
MRLRNKIIQVGSALVATLVIGTTNLQASELEYQEAASDVIMNSLKGQGKYSFLRKLYSQLFFTPLWMHEKDISKAAKELFNHIKNDATLDKMGKLYQDVLLLEAMTAEVYGANGTTAQKVDLEFKISQLYEGYTNYAYLGSINWGAFNARISNLMVNDVSTEWVLHRPDVNALTMAEHAALGGSLGQELKKAIPNKYKYKALQKELVKYRAIKANGGWTPILLTGTLKAGASTQGVYDLRERLRVTGDYVPCENSTEGLVYDKCLQGAVKRFQKRNGLSVDGEVGPGTLKVLNKTVDERITTILLNLDRIKWLKERNAKRHVIINIPDFMLYFEEDGKLRQSIRTVVGKPKNPTPIFSNTVKTIVLNPYWNLPTSIIQKEMIPKLLKNSNAMAKKGIEISTGWGKNAKKIKASSVDWAQYRYSKGVPFRFAQVPGPRNALGKVKFLFPNKYAVYMHDTPSKSLFNRSRRAFSHGCIRLQKPRELLKTFASFNSNIDFAKSQKILKGKDKTYMALKTPVPVDVVYLTAWVDYDGKLQFRNDIYNYDKMQLKSFRKW